uniref:tetratricopeptide repeat-containing sensor histidine kinase n=3 Tax=Flavobacterium sp. TaxID=239 RepID=UPI004048F735
MKINIFMFRKTIIMILISISCQAQEIQKTLVKAYQSKDSSEYFLKIAKSQIKTVADEGQYYYCKSALSEKNLDSLEFYGNIAIKKLTEVKDYPSLLTLYTSFGTAFQKRGQYEKAIKHLHTGLKIAEKNNLVFYEAYISMCLSDVYHDFENYDKGLEYGFRSLNLNVKLEDNKTNIKNALNSIATNYDDSNQPDSALVYYFRVFDYFKGSDTLKIGSIYNNIGNTYLKQKKYAKAEEWLKRSLVILEKNSTSNKNTFYYGTKSTIYVNLATIAYIENDFLKAEKLFKEAKIFSNKSENVTKKRDYYQHLAIFNKKRNHLEETIEAQEQYILLRDSIFASERAKSISDLETKYQTEKKEKELLVAKNKLIEKEVALQKEKIAVQQKNNTILMLSIGSGFLLLIGYGFFRKKQLEQKAILLAQQAKQRELLTQAVIEAEETERKRIASDLHDGVGQLFSAVKMNLGGLLNRVEIKKDEDRFLAEKTMALVDESCKEVRVISHKMMPNFLLKSGIASDIKSFIEKIDEQTLKISFESFGFKEQLEFNEEIILYRVIQELINNVIKHAKANELEIFLLKKKQEIQVKITDNGVGFDYEKAIEKGGLGLKNVLVRIEYLKGTVSFKPHAPRGTEVTIVIPLN